jgi:branched-chain amino acid transport system permease protein
MSTVIAQMFVNALMLGGFYILVASGLTLLLGSVKILTLAQGAMCMLGGYGLYYFLEQLHLPYGLSIVLSVYYRIGFYCESTVKNSSSCLTLLSVSGSYLKLA